MFWDHNMISHGSRTFYILALKWICDTEAMWYSRIILDAKMVYYPWKVENLCNNVFVWIWKMCYRKWKLVLLASEYVAWQSIAGLYVYFWYVYCFCAIVGLRFSVVYWTAYNWRKITQWTYCYAKIANQSRFGDTFCNHNAHVLFLKARTFFTYRNGNTLIL